jgi:hypothetical protein
VLLTNRIKTFTWFYDQILYKTHIVYRNAFQREYQFRILIISCLLIYSGIYIHQIYFRKVNFSIHCVILLQRQFILLPWKKSLVKRKYVSQEPWKQTLQFASTVIDVGCGLLIANLVIDFGYSIAFAMANNIAVYRFASKLGGVSTSRAKAAIFEGPLPPGHVFGRFLKGRVQ